MATAGKVLLADDSVTIQKIVDIVLSEKGYEVRSVNTGEDALLAMEGFGPDIVLADVHMPGMSGYQLTEHIRQHPATKSLPVILLAGAFEPLDLQLADKSGADGHIIKPFEAAELASKIEALLKRAAPQPAKPILLDTEELLDFSDIMAEAEKPAEAAEPEAEAEAEERFDFIFPYVAEPVEAAATAPTSEELLTAEIEEPAEAG